MSTIPEYVIRYSTGEGAQSTFQLSASQMVLGSAAGADILIDSPYISREHIRFELIDGRVFITDLNSRNGVMLNGRAIPPGTRQAWPPGTTLMIADLRFDLSAEGGAPAAPATPGRAALQLAAEPDVIRPGESAALHLYYDGSEPQTVALRAETEADGLELQIHPNGAYILPQQALDFTLSVHQRRTYWAGGSFPVRVFVTSNLGQDALTEVRVRVRPRYELLLLLLLLLIGAGAVLAVGGGFGSFSVPISTPTETPTPETPTLTETATATGTASVTATATQTDSPTPTITATPSATRFPTSTTIPSRTPTLTRTPTRTPTPCFNQCAALGWPTYIVKPGETLARLAQLAGASVQQVQQVNCLPNVNIISAGQSICFPRLPVTEVPPPVARFTFAQVPLGSNQLCDVQAGAIRFTNQSQNANQYLWEFGDGTTSAEANPTHIYTVVAADGGLVIPVMQPGEGPITQTYTVRLTALNGALSNSVTAQVTVEIGFNPNCLDASFTFDVTEQGACQVGVFFTNTSRLGARSYEWQFGDGSTGSGFQTFHTYQRVPDDGTRFQTITYTARLTVRNNQGGSDTRTASVPVSFEGLCAGTEEPVFID